MDTLNDIANEEFGLDYDQLGSSEQEWCRDEEFNLSLCRNGKPMSKCTCC